uniref:Uncharacterized protein n=1 Tax=viral metagenome TaxID=1070528 RepID=A0A6C0D8R0_9ZZZZ
MSSKRKADTEAETEQDQPRTPPRDTQLPGTPSTGATIPEYDNSPSIDDYWTNLLKNTERQRLETESRQADARADEARGIYEPPTVYAGKLTGRAIYEKIDNVLVPLTREKLLAKFKQYYYEDGTPIPKSDITGNLADDMTAESKGGKKKRKSNKRITKRRKSNKRTKKRNNKRK